MKTLYIDCSMGVAGDMFAAALLELTDKPAESLRELNDLEIPGAVFTCKKIKRNYTEGTLVSVMTDEEESAEHIHRTIHDIEKIVRNDLKTSDKVKDSIMSVYDLIAQAESEVHGLPKDEIRFHEVGSIGSLCDIAAVCYLIDKLNTDQIIASAVHAGKGSVKCAHGILPVPAPATAIILKDIPYYSKEEIEGELCTPTGAALLKSFVKEFKEMETSSAKKTGYGMGTKDLGIPGCLRICLLEDN